MIDTCKRIVIGELCITQNIYLECPWPPSPGSRPLTERRQAAGGHRVHDPGAGLAMAGYCGLCVGMAGAAINTTGTRAARDVSMWR